MNAYLCNCLKLIFFSTSCSVSETKSEEYHYPSASTHSFEQASNDTISSSIDELDQLLRKIIGGVDVFDHHGNSSSSENKNMTQSHPQPSKRNSPSTSSSLETMLFQHNQSLSNPNVRREKVCEKIMWGSASILSNSCPSPSFVITRQDRDRRLRQLDVNDNDETSTIDYDPPIQERGGGGGENNDQQVHLFEGSVANATPGNLNEGGTGVGTAQHAACLLDSPFALTLLIVLGVSIDARHTAFRRLAVHEAACADSPLCLGLLMELGSRFSLELFSETVDPTSSTAAAAAGSGSFESCNDLCSSSNNGVKVRPPHHRKPGKKKLNPFRGGWNKGKQSNGGSSILKKCPSDENEDVVEHTSFPVALKVMCNAMQLLRTGDMSEIDAAHYVLDRVSISKQAKLVLALQCPHLPPTVTVMQVAGLSNSSSPFATISSFSTVNDPFRSNHRDMQTLFIKRNVDGHGNTPIHWAAFKNSVRAMDVLLSFNVDVNIRAQPSGWTPLHDAAYSDASNAVARLIEAGASVDARSHSGATPLCFAAQEDAPNATRILLKAGADPSMRCLGNSPGIYIRANNADNNQFHSRFSGYTPLHYCAHYNAAKAARVLLYERNVCGVNLLEIADLNDKLPIHVAVARGSSQVLRELLHGGARVETPSYQPAVFTRPTGHQLSTFTTQSTPLAIPRNDGANDETAHSTSSIVVTPVSSPILRAMIPSQPVTSAKPWNCLSQNSIEECKHLMTEVELNWTPERHPLFCPSDRQAILEVLRVGKRMEQAHIFLDLWPHVLSFCGRAWFEPVRNKQLSAANRREYIDEEEEISLQLSNSFMDLSGADSSMDSSGEEMEEFTQFELDVTSNH